MADATKLPRLPEEVKRLVNDGVYSLYSIDGAAPVTYVLVTNANELYELDASGGVLAERRYKKLAEVPVKEAISFPEMDSGPVLKINYAG